MSSGHGANRAVTTGKLPPFWKQRLRARLDKRQTIAATFPSQRERKACETRPARGGNSVPIDQRLSFILSNQRLLRERPHRASALNCTTGKVPLVRYFLRHGAACDA